MSSLNLSGLNAERIFIRRALRIGFTIEGISQLAKIHRWFRVLAKKALDCEKELAGA